VSAEIELARLERQVLGIARVSRFLDAVDELRRMLAREDPRLRARVIALVAPAIGKDLAAAVGAAFNIGVTDAVKMIGEGAPDRAPSKPPAPLVSAARATERAIADEISKARKLARAGADEATILAPVSAARNIVERDVVTLVNAAGNAGATALADAAGLPTVWIAETNACVECLAYSGRVAKPGKTFPGGLTYGAKSYNPEPIAYPPRHPRCRCTVEPLRSSEYADALRREADRSVLRGYSLESESMKTRIDAADRLVARGVDAPKSVIAYARRSIKAGEFPTRGRP
jgi:hypothetical protein